jgi:Protein of unknown function (DUF2905)
MARMLVWIGVSLILAGLLWPWLQKIGLGRLPGDIVIGRGNTRFNFPLTTCVLVSFVLSLLWWLWRR